MQCHLWFAQDGLEKAICTSRLRAGASAAACQVKSGTRSLWVKFERLKGVASPFTWDQPRWLNPLQPIPTLIYFVCPKGSGPQQSMAILFSILSLSSLISGWWFGTFLFFHILGIIIPTDFHIFQRGRYTTNQILLIFSWCCAALQKPGLMMAATSGIEVWRSLWGILPTEDRHGSLDLPPLDGMNGVNLKNPQIATSNQDFTPTRCH